MNDIFSSSFSNSSTLDFENTHRFEYTISTPKFSESPNRADNNFDISNSSLSTPNKKYILLLKILN
jgi:hypothetical protein